MTSVSSIEQIETIRRIRRNLDCCILGKNEIIKLVLAAFLAEGHILLEDVPGTGKTVLIKALAKTINGQFRRIQCNPDLLPTDITGVSIFHPKEQTFVFRPGPVMTNILLIDEINRATTKTQSALLEAMEERHVTVDGETYQLPRPFILLATQNPIDFEGTYMLPEAQLDRFLLKISLGYPDEETERGLLNSHSVSHPLESLQPVTEIHHIIALQQAAKQIYVDQALQEYLVTVVRKTREHPAIFLGASPRATLGFLSVAKAYALVAERDYVIPDDIKMLAPYVLGHRMILHAEARMTGASITTVLESIFQHTKVPAGLEK
ncbi:MAG TPA: MoxR family ATPase [Bacilli bacterium]